MLLAELLRLVADEVLLSSSAEEAVAIHAVYPHRRHLAPKVPAFVNFLIEKFTPPPWEIMKRMSGQRESVPL